MEADEIGKAPLNHKHGGKKMFNRVFLIGRLGVDPEMRYSQGGKAITKFRMATDSGWGESRQTDWHNIVTFDKTAENCAKYLSKGRQVFVEGRISYRKWEKDDGSTQYFTEIIASDVRFLGGSKDKGEEERPVFTTRPESLPPLSGQNFEEDPEEGFAGDIPF